MKISPSHTKKCSNLLLSKHTPNEKKLKQLKQASSFSHLFFQKQQLKYNIYATYKVNVPKINFLTNFEVYQWRKQTQFPIVKVASIKTKGNQFYSSQLVELTVLTEYCPLKLADLKQVPLNQSLYLLKEALVGFQILYYKFGLFWVESQMICINQRGKCKVWLNQNLGLNTPSKVLLLESTMVQKIISILELHTLCSPVATRIFQALKTSESFFESLRLLDRIVEVEKVKPTKKYLIDCKPKELAAKSRRNGSFYVAKQHSNKKEPSPIRLSVKSCRGKQSDKPQQYEKQEIKRDMANIHNGLKTSYQTNETAETKKKTHAQQLNSSKSQKIISTYNFNNNGNHAHLPPLATASNTIEIVKTQYSSSKQLVKNKSVKKCDQQSNFLPRNIQLQIFAEFDKVLNSSLFEQEERKKASASQLSSTKLNKFKDRSKANNNNNPNGFSQAELDKHISILQSNYKERSQLKNQFCHQVYI